MLEMTKLIPELLRKFDFELTGGLENKDKELDWTCLWFLRPGSFPVKVSLRHE